jgi:hypothetical protein
MLQADRKEFEWEAWIQELDHQIIDGIFGGVQGHCT